MLPPLDGAFRTVDPKARLTPMDEAAKLVIDLAWRLSSPSCREQLHAAHTSSSSPSARPRRWLRRNGGAPAQKPGGPGRPVRCMRSLATWSSVLTTVPPWARLRLGLEAQAAHGDDVPREAAYTYGAVPEHLKTERQRR